MRGILATIGRWFFLMFSPLIKIFSQRPRADFNVSLPQKNDRYCHEKTNNETLDESMLCPEPTGVKEVSCEGSGALAPVTKLAYNPNNKYSCRSEMKPSIKLLPISDIGGEETAKIASKPAKDTIRDIRCPASNHLENECALSKNLWNSLKDTRHTGIQHENEHKELKAALSTSVHRIKETNINDKIKGPGLSKKQKKYKARSKQRRRNRMMKQLKKNPSCSLVILKESDGMKDLKKLKCLHGIGELKDYLGYDEIDLVLNAACSTVMSTSSFTSIAYPVVETEDEAEVLTRLLTFVRYTGNGSSVNLARGGFVCEQDGDATRCYVCNLNCSDWNFYHNVEERHRQLSPHCPLLPPVDGANNNNVVPSLPANHNVLISENQIAERNMTLGANSSDNTRNLCQRSAEQNSNVDVPRTPVLQPNGASARPADSTIYENSERHRQAYQENPEEVTLFLRELRGNYNRRRRGHELEVLDTGQVVPDNCETTRPSSHVDTSREAAQRNLADRRKLINENRELRRMIFCEQCKRNEIGLLLLPCRHLCLCEPCAQTIHRCPMCKQEIKTKMKVYW